MTTPIRVNISGAMLEAAIPSLLDEQEPAGYTLPAAILELGVRIQTLNAAEDVLHAARRMVNPTAQAAARDQVLADLAAAASRGEQMAAPSASLLEMASRFAAVEADRALIEFAWLTASQQLHEQLIDRTSEIADAIGEALDKVLTAAASAAALLDGFAYGDPGALARAPKAVQAGFATLEGLTARHDACRRAAWALYAVNLRRPAGEGIAYRFAGGGLDLEVSTDTFNNPAGDNLPQVVRTKFQGARLALTGHPVERLAIASLAARHPVPA